MFAFFLRVTRLGANRWHRLAIWSSIASGVRFCSTANFRGVRTVVISGHRNGGGDSCRESSLEAGFASLGLVTAAWEPSIVKVCLLLTHV